MMDYLMTTLSKIDEKEVAKRVEKLRGKNPNVSTDELAEKLIQQKCMQAGAIGAITSGTAIVPGLGTITSLTFGVVTDIGMTLKLQAELVLEVAAAYQHELDASEKRKAIILVAGFSTGSSQLITRAGQEIAERTTERLAAKGIAKAIPLLGVAASAGVNIASTYIIGKRAQAYFKLGPEAMQDWNESAHAITGIDEQKIVAWLSEATERSWKLASESAQNLSGVMIVAGKSAGELVVIHAGKAGEAISDASKAMVTSAGTTAGNAVEIYKRADTRMSASKNPFVRFYAASLRTYIQIEKRWLMFLVAVVRGIFNVVKAVGKAISSVFGIFSRKKGERPPESPSNPQTE